MKKIILTLAIIAGFVFNANAQKKQKQHQKPDFTVEQQTTIAVKKLTLALDLSESQQKKMYPLLLTVTTNKQKMMEERKANKDNRPELSSDEIYAKMIAKLDQQIAFQGKVKEVLNKDQYEKWKKMKAHMAKEKFSDQKGSQKHGGKKGKPSHQ